MFSSNVIRNQMALRSASSGIFHYAILPPDENKARDELERLKEGGGQRPPRRPGDEYIIAGTLAGFVGGVIIAGIVRPMPWVFIVGAIGGGITGTLLGSLVGTLITRSRRPKNNPRYY